MTVHTATSPELHATAGPSPMLMQAVESRMLSVVRQMSSPSDGTEPVAQQAASYHLMSGGQRIRAQLAIHAGLALQLAVGDIVSVAAAAELIHNASLVHDDLQDRDATRHGVDTVWTAYGDGVAICTGDLLLSAAYAALSGVSQPHLLPVLMSMLHRRVADATAGQCADLHTGTAHVVSIDQYMNIAALKSGALLALPMELVLALAGERSAIGVASRAAESFAIGYQIYDDLNDVHRDRSRPSARPAINAVDICEASQLSQAGDDHHGQAGGGTALARALAQTHLTAAANTSLLLPQQCGQRLHQLAIDLSARLAQVRP